MFDWIVKEEIKAANAIILGDKSEEDGRPFKARFLQAGLVKYNFGVCLLKKETIDRFVNTFMECPVIIGHKDDISKNEIKGSIKNIWFCPEDGWFWCSGVLDEEAAKKVEKGFNVSCQYRITEYSNNTENKLHNGNPYDKEILNGVFEHLAIVENPRYEDAYIAVNAIMASNDHWITIGADEEEGKKGHHVLVREGETNKEATERKVAEWKEKGEKKEETKKREIEHKGAKIDIIPDGKYSDIKIYAPDGKTFQNGDTFYTTTALTENAEEHAKKIIDGTSDRNEWLDKKDTTQKSREIEHNGAKANIKPDGKYADIKIFAPEGKTFPNGDSWYSTQKETEKAEEQVKEIIEKTKWIDKKQPGTKQEGKQPTKKYNYTVTKKEAAKIGQIKGMADTGNYYTNADFAIDKNYMNLKGIEAEKKEDLEKTLKQILKGDQTYRYKPVKDFEVGELLGQYSKKPIKVAKYSYKDEKTGETHEIYLNKKYNDLFKNFDLKFGKSNEIVYAYDNDKIIGGVMPIGIAPDAKFTKAQNEIEEEETEEIKEQLKLFKAQNSFLEQFKDMLYETLAEGIVDRLGEFRAANEERWITIHPHGEDSEDYRRLKIEDGETPKEAIDRVYKKDDKKKEEEDKKKNNVKHNEKTFTPANNLKDALKETNNYINTIMPSFSKNISLENLNKINSAFDFVYNNVCKFKNLEEIKKKKLKDDALAAANDSVMVIGSMFNYDTQKCKEEFDKEVTNWTKDQERAIGIIENSSVLSTREKIKNIKKCQENLKFKRFGVYSSPDNLIKETIIHELGHTISIQAMVKEQKEAGKITFGFGDRTREVNKITIEQTDTALLMKKTLQQARENGDIYNISKYADTNIHEFYAECFLMYHIGEKQPDYIKDMVEKIIKKL